MNNTTPTTQDHTTIMMAMSQVIQDMDIPRKVYEQTHHYYKAQVHKSSPARIKESDGQGCPRVIFYAHDPVFGGFPEEIGTFALYSNPRSLDIKIPGTHVLGMDVTQLQDTEEDRQKVRDAVTTWLDLLATLYRV